MVKRPHQMGVLQVPWIHVGILPPSPGLRLRERLISILTTDGLPGPQPLINIVGNYLPLFSSRLGVVTLNHSY